MSSGYFVIAPAGTAKEASVKALNIIKTTQSDTLHEVMAKYTSEDCKTAPDHDPLVSELTTNMSLWEHNE